MVRLGMRSMVEEYGGGGLWRRLVEKDGGGGWWILEEDCGGNVYPNAAGGHEELRGNAVAERRAWKLSAQLYTKMWCARKEGKRMQANVWEYAWWWWILFWECNEIH